MLNNFPKVKGRSCLSPSLNDMLLPLLPLPYCPLPSTCPRQVFPNISFHIVLTIALEVY